MARLKFEGTEKYVQMLESIKADTEGSIKRAVYEGAKVVADEIKRGLQSLTTSEHGLTEEEKQGLIKGFGLADMRKEKDYINTKAGFVGRSSRITKKQPNGVPNATIARQIESGTSWMKKQPVIRQATRQAKARAEAAIAAEITKEIKEHLTGG